MMHELFRRIGERKLVPVLVLERVEQAAPLADALVAGGLPVAEITFRTDAAEAAIRVMADRGDMLVGAGTVLTIEQADRAIDAGAAFVVAPGTNPRVIEHCLRRDIPIAPGVATPTDIELALSLGLNVLKYFPAEALGGTKMLRAIAGPYRDVRFIPTGGISPQNLGDYLRLPNVLACGGSWLAPPAQLAAHQYQAIEQTIAHAVHTVQHASLPHHDS